MRLLRAPLDTVAKSYRLERLECHQFDNRLFQTSTMAALLDAVYDGEVTVEQLMEHGDFGIGTFNALDGEMVVNNGIVHQLRSDGHAAQVPSDLETPFACVTYFRPEKTVEVEHPLDKKDLEALVDGVIGNPNIYAAIRFTGQFEKVDTRTVFCQCRPYPPMLDVVRRQPTRHFGESGGTMLGFRTPGFMQGINVAGFHLHFLTDDQKKGGHVTDYIVANGVVEIAAISDLEIQLPRTKQFAEANLSPRDIDNAIRTAEGG